MTRVAFYRRVSSQEQAKEGVSLIEQKERLELWAKLEGWDFAGDYCDEGVSGGADNRPELQRLMYDAKMGSFDLVAVTKLDRFMRNTRLLLNYIYELEELGIGFAAQSEMLDTRKAGIGKIMLALLGAVAEWERDRIGERIQNFRSYLAGKGRWSSGRTPFGYRFNKQTKELEKYEPEAQVIRYIFNIYVNDSLGLIRLAEQLNIEQKLTPRWGRRKHNNWTQSAVRHILIHPAYKGGQTESWRFKCPAIVEPTTWCLAQKRLLTNRHFKPAKSHAEFQGLLKCGLCGHTLRIAYDHNARKYECPGRLKRWHLDGSPRCTLSRFPAEELETSLKNQITNIFSDPKVLIEHLKKTQEEAKQRKQQLQRELTPLYAERERIEKNMEIADTKLEMKRIDPVTYKAVITGLRAKLHSLERQQKEADPLLLANYNIADADVVYCQRLMDRISEWGAEAIAPMAIGSPRGWIAKYGITAFVYPDHIDLKGSLPIEASGQSDVSPDYRLDCCQQSQ